MRIRAALVSSLLVSVAATAQPLDRPALDSFLDSLEAEYGDLTAVRYRFEQVQRLPELVAAVELTGMVWHQRPSELRLEARGSESFDLLCDGETVWWVDRELGEVESFALARLREVPVSRLLPPLVLDDPADWRKEFSIVEFEEEGSRRRLVLEPASGSTRRFESLVLVFRGRRLRKSIARYGEGDEVVTDYSHWERLGRISRAHFRYRGGD